MIISLIILGFVISGMLAWFMEHKVKQSAKIIALGYALLSLVLFIGYLNYSTESLEQLYVIQQLSWIPFFNIEYLLAIDYLSAILVTLTLILAVICVLVSWHEIKEKSGFYYFNLLTAIAGIIGVFCAVDLFLFFFFWEVMLLPMTALIAIWGHENRKFAAIKFFIFTQVSSLLMLVAIIYMGYLHAVQTGQWSFNYFDWLSMGIPLAEAQWLMLGFFIAFAVKLPCVPLHSWLPDAHTQAPTGGSVLLAGVLLKTGAYGLIRYVIFLFPEASQEFANIAMFLGVLSVLYGAKLAFAQVDLKRMIAYSSISHMGFVTIALFSFSSIAYQGALITLIAHGISSAALFSLAGMIYTRLHTRDLNLLGGLWTSAPRLGGFALAFAAAAFGLPGLANFIGEFLTLVGAFQQFPYYTAVAALGLIGSAIYGMVLFQKSFQGPVSAHVIDLTTREFVIHGSLFLMLLILGLFPNLLLSNIPTLAMSFGHEVITTTAGGVA